METIRLGLMTISAACIIGGWYVEDPSVQRMMTVAFVPGIALYLFNNDRSY